MAKQISAVICEKNGLFREGLRHIMREHGYRVPTSVSALDELPENLLEKLGATLLIVGLAEIGDDDLDVLRSIRTRQPRVYIIVLVDRCTSRQVSDVLDARIGALLLKSTSSNTLLKSLELVLLDEHVFTARAETTNPSGMAPVKEIREQSPVRPTSTVSTEAQVALSGGGESDAVVLNYGRNSLSERERDILSCLVRGCSNKIIARQCSITEATVKVHMKAILRKIQVRNRTQAAVWAIGQDLRPSLSTAAAIQNNVAPDPQAMASTA